MEPLDDVGSLLLRVAATGIFRKTDDNVAKGEEIGLAGMTN